MGPTSMHKAVFSIIALLVVGYIINAYLDKQAERRAEIAEEERIRNTTIMALNEMVDGRNAVIDWEEKISLGEGYRLKPIMTVELENLWLQKRPIIFVGSISDIATHDEDHYKVIIDRMLGMTDVIFDTELQLSLIASKETIDNFLKSHPEVFKFYSFQDNVAVLAYIRSINTIYLIGNENERVTVKIGEGELIDLLYTGDVIF